MKNLQQIKAVVYYAITGTRYWSLNHILLYPILELISLGFLTKYLLGQGTNANVLAFLAMVPIVAQAIHILNLQFTINYQEHLWNGTGIHLGASPVKIYNWIIGSLIYSLTMMVGTITSMLLYFYFFINFPVGSILSNIPLIATSSIMVGLALAFFSISMLILFDHRGGEAVWMSAYLLGIISGLQYPVSVLPNWLATIARFSPMQPLFEGVRRIVYGQDHITETLIRANVSGAIWLTLMLILGRIALKSFYVKGKVSVFIR